ncbi:MAG: hypothetical protein MUP98_13825 [Candidatus Aminicenantes bacterium]|nr:hypothetical protein [Candidatus Aminicenantes bacterium]
MKLNYLRTTILLVIILLFSFYPLYARQSLPPDNQSSIKKENLLSGLSLKFGWLQSVYLDRINDKWLASVALNFGLGRNFAWGFEIQPSYQSEKFTDISMKIIPIMGFLNLKGGMKFLFPTFFAGAGVGAMANYTSIKYDGETYSDFSVIPAYHFLAGFELDLKSFALLIEYQMIKVIDPDIDPDSYTHYLLLGIRF